MPLTSLKRIFQVTNSTEVVESPSASSISPCNFFPTSNNIQNLWFSITSRLQSSIHNFSFFKLFIKQDFPTAFHSLFPQTNSHHHHEPEYLPHLSNLTLLFWKESSTGLVIEPNLTKWAFVTLFLFSAPSFWLFVSIWPRRFSYTDMSTKQVYKSLASSLHFFFNISCFRYISTLLSNIISTFPRSMWDLRDIAEVAVTIRLVPLQSQAKSGTRKPKSGSK